MTDPNRTSEVCMWCDQTLAQHRDSGPMAKMPCGGLKRGFRAERAKPITETSVGDVPAPIIVEVADTPFNRELRRQMAAEADALRVERWHATYNAALMGMYAFGGGDMSNAEADGQAQFAANLAHGELPK